MVNIENILNDKAEVCAVKAAKLAVFYIKNREVIKKHTPTNRDGSFAKKAEALIIVVQINDILDEIKELNTLIRFCRDSSAINSARADELFKSTGLIIDSLSSLKLNAETLFKNEEHFKA